MKQVVAQRQLLYSPIEGGERKPLMIRVSVPYWDESGRAACDVEMEGLFNEYGPMVGIDLLHALKLAADIDPLLEKLRRKYNFFWPDGEPYHDDEERIK
jgi:hypothetical protein